MEMKYKICFLGYKTLSEIASKIISKLNYSDTEILLIDAIPSTMSDAINHAVRWGCEVFVAGAANASEFKRRSDMPLVEIRIQAIDYAIAIKKALKIGKFPAIVNYRYSKGPDITILEMLLNTKIICHEYEDALGLEHIVKNSPSDVIIGGASEIEMAQKYGKNGVLIYHGEEEIKYAISRARAKAEDIRKFSQSKNFISSIINNFDTGIIGTDANGYITYFNKESSKLLGLLPEQVIKKLYFDVLPAGLIDKVSADMEDVIFSMKRFRGINFNIKTVKLVQNGNFEGALTILSKKLSLNSISKKTEAFKKISDISPPVKTFQHLIAYSSAMKQSVEQAKLYALQPETLIIYGAVGTGKDFIAECIHNYAGGNLDNMVRINCAGIPGNLTGQYFLGRESNTGQIITQGVFEKTENGTIILDNIEETPTAVQRIIIYVLQNRQYCRINGTIPIPFSSRIIAISSCEQVYDLKNQLIPGFYYAISKLKLQMPFLRQRREDILEIFQRTIQSNLTYRNHNYKISNSIMPILLEYSWPGNSDELSGVALRFSLVLERQKANSPAGQRRALIDSIGETEIFQDVINTYGGLDIIKNDKELLLKCLDKLKTTFCFNNDTIATNLNISRTTIWRIQKNQKDNE